MTEERRALHNIVDGKFVGYHCTDKENIPSIMEHGLCPERFGKMGFWEGTEEDKRVLWHSLVHITKKSRLSNGPRNVNYAKEEYKHGS